MSTLLSQQEMTDTYFFNCNHRSVLVSYDGSDYLY